MIEVLVEVQAGSCNKHLYDDKSLQCQGMRQVSHPYPYAYGFILGTATADGQGVDCYIITQDPLKPGTIVACEPVGLLEMIEDGDIDHKVLATIPGQTVKIDRGLHHVLRKFIYNVFARYPEASVQVGRMLPKRAAVEHLQKFRDP